MDRVHERVERGLRQIRQPDQYSLLGDRLALQMANERAGDARRLLGAVGAKERLPPFREANPAEGDKSLVERRPAPRSRKRKE